MIHIVYIDASLKRDQSKVQSRLGTVDQIM